jgi:hypothetical protein
MEKAITRRTFFQHLLQEAVVTVEEAQGVQHFKIKHLPDLPNAQLGQIIPRFTDGLHLKVENGRLLLSNRQPRLVKEVCAVDSIEKAVLSRINGKFTIGEIAYWLAVHYQLLPELAFRRTRTFFLTLALKGLCVPANPLS